MSIIPPISPPGAAGPTDVIYPSSDGRPVAETPLHRDVLLFSVDILRDYFAAEPDVYVSGNMLMYYDPSDKRKHVSPDVFVVRGIPKDKPRDYYLVWEEAHGPDVVIEITSKSTCDEDADEKLVLYRDILRVSEVFLFDPREEYLDPPLQGHRLRDGKYERIVARSKRLPSDVLGLHLEADGDELRFHNPATGRWLPTSKEALAAAKAQATAADAQATAAKAQAKAADARADIERRRAEGQQAENERLRREIELLKLGHQPGE